MGIQKLQPLYKRDNTGGTRIWYAEIDGGSYRLCSGKLGGSSPVQSSWTLCEVKNLGRSNETSAEEQAKQEVQSHYTKKRKRGYTENLEAIDQAKEDLIEPMLAHDYADHKHKLTFPVYSQPKLDGIRCIANADGLWSRKGEQITTVPHIAELIVPLCRAKKLVFDGELYNHDLREDFNEIASLVRREKSDAKHAAKVRDVVQYHIYDLVDCNAPFIDRWRHLNDVIGYNIEDHDINCIEVVETKRHMNQTSLDGYYEFYVEDGYEGQMVRTNALYQHKRTSALLKRKEFQDEEFEIIGMVEGKGNRSGMVGAIVFALPNGKQFQAALMGTNDYRRKIWKEHLRKPFVGCDATVKYFHKTPGGVPRFPVVKSIDEGK